MSVGDTDKNDGSQYGWTVKPVPRVRATMVQEIIQRGAGARKMGISAARKFLGGW